MEPEIAPALRTSAVDHLDKALVGYREHSGPTTAENADAKFAFTWLVVLFAYAIPPSVPPIDAMTELFLLVKGIDSVLAESWFWVSQGPFAPILTRGFQEAITLPPETYAPPEGMDFGLNHLDYMLNVDAILLDDRRRTPAARADERGFHPLLSKDGVGAVLVAHQAQGSAGTGGLGVLLRAVGCAGLEVVDSWLGGKSAEGYLGCFAGALADVDSVAGAEYTVEAADAGDGCFGAAWADGMTEM
ncbi:hypothetical protein LTS16_002939 [Friedmanniomyces endolithicus]|nr:hypothetical protein LTR59_017754 [Friedmanniomyces endolithicus]KAK0772478.1 hypothetical protein LTR38_016885 [Friedmanniomyces endolithicus]KAK0869285.1 hypothetical protein LTS02_003053 [Friedmanniomyces endolithicus]KAK0905699.1 hypothetical protein LTR57_018120 [Friedmanniomyces endolithicus]KAK0995520.1 hypothetical protein LTS01_006712 [Friedmanniomyces endolithicus]